MKTNSFLTNQAVSPVELLARLSHIKSSNETSSLKLKQIKQLQDNLSFYERYGFTTLQNLHNKLQSLSVQAAKLKSSYMNVQEIGLEKFDHVQKMLEQTLNKYENDRKEGETMIKQMVQRVQQKLQQSILQKSMKSSQLVQEYLFLNTRLQSILQSLNSMENQLISKYERLKTEINKKFTNLSGSIRSDIDQAEKNSIALMRKLQQIENQCQLQIEKINEKKEKKRYRMHEMLEKMIEDTIEGSQTQ